MPRMGFEPTILVFERAKNVHALDSPALNPTKFPKSISRLGTEYKSTRTNDRDKDNLGKVG
jgi:hypothetical protein